MNIMITINAMFNDWKLFCYNLNKQTVTNITNTVALILSTIFSIPWIHLSSMINTHSNINLSFVIHIKYFSHIPQKSKSVIQFMIICIFSIYKILITNDSFTRQKKTFNGLIISNSTTQSFFTIHF